MPRSSPLPEPAEPARPPAQLRLRPLMDLLEQQDPALRKLFAKALNTYAAPGAEGLSDREKLDHLRKALEESLTQTDTPC